MGKSLPADGGGRSRIADLRTVGTGASGSTAPGRLLVVEDESIVGADIAATLKRFGYDVVGVSTSVDDCLRKAESQQPHMTLMDINLNGHMEGIDCAVELRERLGIPSIFLTAYADDRTLERAKTAQPVGYLIKPFKPNDLRVVVEMGLNKRTLERTLEHQQIFLETIFDWAGVGIAILDDHGEVLQANRTLEQMLGHRGDTRHLESLSHPDLAVRERRLFRQLMDGEREQYQLETRYVRANDEIGLGYVTASRVAVGEQVRAIRVMSDISYARLEKVASFQENERHLISSEIHDVVSQPLAGVFYRLQATQQVLTADPTRAHEELAASLHVVQHLLEELSRLIYNLRSPVLDAGNIADAIDRLGGEFRRESSIILTLQVPRRIVGIGKLQSLFLYRIVQESLANARRHSGAKSVRVEMSVADGRLKGKVCDDGNAPADGYERDEEHKRKHFGIRAMRERAELLGGNLQVLARDEGGTCVCFELPIGEESNDES